MKRAEPAAQLADLREGLKSKTTRFAIRRRTLAGKGAVVTGGGRGIGAAVAEALAIEGASVVVTARTRDEVEWVAEGLELEGWPAHALVCDVTDPESVSAMALRAQALVGGVDILVNNAGVASSAPFLKVTLEEWESVHRVNATGALLVTQAFLPEMLERGWGRIVNVASVAGARGRSLHHRLHGLQARAARDGALPRQGAGRDGSDGQLRLPRVRGHGHDREEHRADRREDEPGRGRDPREP